MQNAPEGQRHEFQLKAAIAAGGYVAAGRMEEQTAVYALETVASEWDITSHKRPFGMVFTMVWPNQFKTQKLPRFDS
ncbi:hypothetical protein GCM10028804_34390 [Larkinella terrae]